MGREEIEIVGDEARGATSKRVLELKRRIIIIVKVLPPGLKRTAFFFILSLYNILSILLDIC